MKINPVIIIILAIALLALEVFSFATTQFALTDLLGNISLLGIRWATILAFTFCAFNAAGIYSNLHDDENNSSQNLYLYIFFACMFISIGNAVLVWWGTCLTLLQHSSSLGNEILNQEQLLSYFPPFVALFVWFTRLITSGLISVGINKSK